MEISFVGYDGYCKEISTSDLVCGVKIDDYIYSGNLRHFTAGSCVPVSTSCKCQKVQVKVMFSLFYRID